MDSDRNLFILNTLGKGVQSLAFADRVLEDIKPTVVITRLDRTVAPIFEVPAIQSPYISQSALEKGLVTDKRVKDTSEQEEIEEKFQYEMVNKKLFWGLLRGHFLTWWLHKKNFFQEFPFPVPYENAAVAKLAQFKGIKVYCEQRCNELKVLRWLGMSGFKDNYRVWKEARAFFKEQNEKEFSGFPSFDTFVQGAGDRSWPHRNAFVELQDFEEDLFFMDALKRSQSKLPLGVVDWMDEETLYGMAPDEKDRGEQLTDFTIDHFDTLVDYFDYIHSFDQLKTEREEMLDSKMKEEQESDNKENK